MPIVPVQLGSRSYDICIGSGVLDTLGARCGELFPGKRCLIISDSNVAPLYANRVKASLQAAGCSATVATVTAGEPSKSIAMLDEMWSACIQAGLDRKSFIVALGGGVVGDLAGFVAASFLRGIDFVQVPTSLLAMVDSSVGGKTGLNLTHGKNLVGAFHQPRLVLADLDVLKTLPAREFSAGMAEVIKYGVIWSSEMFGIIEKNVEAIRSLDVALLTDLVKRSCEIKAEVVRQDEREGGLRAILNYGHTLGHAIENIQGYGELLHGEAISIGMVYASRLSEVVCDLPSSDTERQAALFSAFDLPVDGSAYCWEDLLGVMSLDKKAENSIPKFVLADRLGKANLPVDVDQETLKKVFSKGR